MIVVILHRRHYLQPEFLCLCRPRLSVVVIMAMSENFLMGWFCLCCSVFGIWHQHLHADPAPSCWFCPFNKKPCMHVSACISPSSRPLLHLAGGKTNGASLPAYVCLSAVVESRKGSLLPSGSAQCSGTSLKIITAWRKKMGRPKIYTTSQKF